MQNLTNFINGQFVPPIKGQYIDVINPATAEVYAQLPRSQSEDVAMAVEAARNAQSEWTNSSPESRFRYLNRIADILERRLDEFAAAESRDSGKPLHLATSVDIPRSISNFRFFATAAPHFASESHFMEEQPAINYTLRRPIGTVGCISPWNLPLYLFTWKLAPALAAGNCVIGKPSEVTPYTAWLLGEVAQEAGLPAGVLNIVHGLGPEVGAAIVSHPKIKAISFTGSTRAGAEIARVAAPMFKKLSLELGGKNATIVFSDADFELAVSTALRASFTNQGQICLCGSRILVQRDIYDRFRDELVRRAQQLKVGDPSAPDTNVGALVSDVHYQKVKDCITLAHEEGGKLLCGGEAAQVGGAFSKGYFLQPTLFEGLSATCRTNQEEIFGPVATLLPFDTEEEALEMANSTPYGLSANVFTTDLSRAHRVAAALETGIVWVNCWMLRDLRTPFGGVKASGVGREGGWEVFRFFTEPKNVCVKY